MDFRIKMEYVTTVSSMLVWCFLLWINGFNDQVDRPFMNILTYGAFLLAFPVGFAMYKLTRTVTSKKRVD